MPRRPRESSAHNPTCVRCTADQPNLIPARVVQFVVNTSGSEGWTGCRQTNQIFSTGDSLKEEFVLMELVSVGERRERGKTTMTTRSWLIGTYFAAIPGELNHALGPV